MKTKQPSITCPKCHRTSYHPQDIRWGWCAACNNYTSDPSHPQVREGKRECFLILTATGHPCGGELVGSGMANMDICTRCGTWMGKTQSYEL